MTKQQDLKALMKETGEPRRSAAFRPCAVYDELLDCIRVIARDCSTTEIRIDGLITVVKENHPASGERKYVGFTIKGAKHFCQTHGLSLTGPIRLTELLDKILSSSSSGAVQLFVDLVARPLVEEKDIRTVTLARAA